MFGIVDKTIIFVYLAGFVGFLGFLLGIISLIKIREIKRNNEILFSGKEAKSLEDIILNNSLSITQMDKEIQELFEISNRINTLSLKGLHKLGIIRFNPFKDIGGNQSFAIALLDGKNSGIVLSSLHTRDGGTRLYAKPITKGLPEEFQLTEEETQAISIAMLQRGNKV